MHATNTDNQQSAAKLVKLAKIWLNGPIQAKEEAFHALMNSDHPKGLSMVREAVTNRSTRLRDYAMDYYYALGEPLSDERKAILTLSHPKWTNRCSAAQFLKRTPSQSGKRALLVQYKLEKHPAVRRDIACALGYWNEKKITEFLVAALTNEQNVTASIGCLDGLVRGGEDSYLGYYLELMSHNDALIRRQVVNSIGSNRFHTKDKVFVLSRLKTRLETEENSGVRDDILSALKGINERGAED